MLLGVRVVVESRGLMDCVPAAPGSPKKTFEDERDLGREDSGLSG